MRVKLHELEEEAERLTHGSYWTMEWIVIMIGCYCVMGLLGLIVLVVSPGTWPRVIAGCAYYIFWFVVAPRILRRAACERIINERG